MLDYVLTMKVKVRMMAKAASNTARDAQVMYCVARDAKKNAAVLLTKK